MSRRNRNHSTLSSHVERIVDRILDDDRVWLAPGLAVALATTALYYQTHPYPAYGAGLFLSIAEQIHEGGYLLPTRIPDYTRGGVPFAYPPLAFYLIAALFDLGADPIEVARVLPGVVTVLTVAPFYALSRELTGSVRKASLSSVAFATAPVVLEWHISAGGIVRAPAFLLLVTGLYCGTKLFRTRRRRWLLPSAGLFGLTVLSHPTYATFFGLSYLLLFAFVDRSIRGLTNGAIVALGGVAFATPWILHVSLAHGPETFLMAAGTHGGLSTDVGTAVTRLARPRMFDHFTGLWTGLAILGGLTLAARRRLLVPVWFLFALAVANELRFAFVPGAMLVGAFVGELLDARELPLPPIRWASTIAAVALVSAMVVAGGGFAAGQPVDGGASLPAYVGDDDEDAMTWIRSETPENATFVALGDGAEWFPYLTNRTMLVGPWGVEWTTPEQYREQLRQYRRLSHCHSAQCLTTRLQRQGIRPDYLYVPTDSYTVRGHPKEQPASMRNSLLHSDRYRVVYEDDDVMIVRVVGAS
ncbi:glycosyltransferase family 39 protein [Halegenticoccus soli]|uniref:glycosyltransferase family 39 protein n=1 Tax=Halegenticoccus soli TaxID=1985678 RepID=UPI000C6EEA0B|nr:glycosyltransferase family 39 protein [Halegenticoccus soli]